MQTPTKNSSNEVIYSNPRIRSFFRFDPIEFSDDVICALNFYINNAVDTIISLLSNVEASENSKQRFQKELIAELQNSIDENADKFELYITRNIFDISVNIDLTKDIDTPKKAKGNDQDGLNDLVNEEEDDLNDAELDQELAELYEKIQASQERRVQLVTSIKSNKAKLNEARELMERLPKINQIIELAEKLPASELESKAQRIKELLDRVKDLASHNDDPAKSLEYEKAAFTFD